MSSDRPDTVLVDPGIFSAGSECSSRSSLGSISLSSSFLSIASIPAGKPLRFTRDVDPVKVKETLLKKVNPLCNVTQPYANVVKMRGLLRKREIYNFSIPLFRLRIVFQGYVLGLNSSSRTDWTCNVVGEASSN